MKHLFTCAFVALISLAFSINASAQEVTKYVSKVTGFTSLVPTNATAMQDTEQALIVLTPDQEFVVTAVPLNIEEISEETLSELLNTLAESADIDLTKATPVDLDNVNLAGSVLVGKQENGTFACVGALETKVGNLGFLVTIVASPSYTGIVDQLLKSLDFSPDVLEE